VPALWDANLQRFSSGTGDEPQPSGIQLTQVQLEKWPLMEAAEVLRNLIVPSCKFRRQLVEE